MKKLKISKELTTIVKNFNVSAYTFGLVEKNNKENILADEGKKSATQNTSTTR